MPTTFEDAPEVEDIAGRLIRDHHAYLRQSDIRYLFRVADSWTKSGKEVYGQATVVSGAMRHIAGDADAVVLVNARIWSDLSDAQREALVDHELTHLQPRTDADGDIQSHPDGRPILCTTSHDVEEFAAVIKRHGLWRPDLERAAAVFRAVPMDLNPPAEEDDRGADMEGAAASRPERRDVDPDTGEVRDIEISVPGMAPVRTNLRELNSVAGAALRGARRRAAL